MIDNTTKGKISVWLGTTAKSIEEFNKYYDGLEDYNSNCPIHRDFNTSFIDTDFFVTYGTANLALLPIHELCEEIGCKSNKTIRNIISACIHAGIHSGNVLSYYRHATFIEEHPAMLYNDMRFIGTFDDL